MNAVVLTLGGYAPPVAANGCPSPRQFLEPRVNGSRLRATLHYHYETAPGARRQAAANDPQYGAAKGRALNEEFHPFGTSAYWSANSAIDVSRKRYRYIGKERDEETGLYQLGARYYASWLGRWTASDPIGLGGGINRFAYSSGNPIRLSDPGGMAPDDGVTLANVSDIVRRSALGPVFWKGGNQQTEGASTSPPLLDQERVHQQASIEATDPAERVKESVRLSEQRAEQQSIGADGVIGTEREHETREQVQRLEDLSSIKNTAGLVTYGVSEGTHEERLARAQMAASAENALGSTTAPVRNVTRSTTARDTGPAPSQKARVLDQRTPPMPRPTEAAGGGGLSNKAIREAYHASLDRIPAQIEGLPLREQALKAFQLRNEAKMAARGLMDPAAVAKLPTPASLPDMVRKAYQRGLTGDDVWRYIRDASTRSNAAVDAAVGAAR